MHHSECKKADPQSCTCYDSIYRVFWKRQVPGTRAGVGVTQKGIGEGPWGGGNILYLDYCGGHITIYICLRSVEPHIEKGGC